MGAAHNDDARPLADGHGIAGTVPATGATRALATHEPAIRASGIGKVFGPTVAIRDCTLELWPGEVHALMGENGSGKSTLVKILSGVHRPDAGEITVAGRGRSVIKSPRDALAIGIATVFQEILVARQQSVLTNIWLGTGGFISRGRSDAQRRQEAETALSRLIACPPLDMDAGDLGLNDRQAVCIARSLVRHPQVLILDEATSALDVTTRDKLFEVISELCARGTSVLLISHRMDEVEAIADRITVMRSGEDVATVVRGEASSHELVDLMTGVAAGAQQGVVATPELKQRELGDVRLSVHGLQLRTAALAIDVDVHAGEMVGVAGLEGHGQDEFLRAIAGLLRVPGEIRLRLGGAGDKQVEVRHQAAALAHGIAYVPRDRRDDSLLPTQSILDNFGIVTVTTDRRSGLVRRASTLRRFKEYADALRIVYAHEDNGITSLSGGNQQKVIIARWLALQPQVLLLNDPTRGVDVGAKADIYTMLRHATGSGMSVVMLSTELAELVELMDRVLVFREGQIFSELSGPALTATRLVSGYFGRDGE